MEGVPQIDSQVEQPSLLSKIEGFPEDISRRMKAIVAELSELGFENKFKVTEQHILSVMETYSTCDSFEIAGLDLVERVRQANGQEKANEYVKALLLLEGVLYEDQIFKQLENHFLAILQDMVNAGQEIPVSSKGDIEDSVFSTPVFLELYKKGLFFRNVNNGYFGDILHSKSSEEQHRLHARILDAQDSALRRFNQK